MYNNMAASAGGGVGDTTDPHYWLSWRFLLCALWVFSCMSMACFLIWRYEGSSDSHGREGRDRGEEDAQHRPRTKPGVVYLDECWRPCLDFIHPAWLLVLRLLSFFILLSLLVVDVLVEGWRIFFYYTQWTFLLVTIYFGLGSLLSIYGCYRYAYKNSGDRIDLIRSDADHGMYMSHPPEESAHDHADRSPHFYRMHDAQEIAGFWGYLFQIMFQTNAGAVVITDLVFWLILFPFLSYKDIDLNFFLVGTHSLNVVFIIGDAALNSLRFPWFRIAYFLLWTGIFVIFQWAVHACISIWWPYPFLDLSSSRAPIWYLAVALLHFPCYALFALLLRLKHSLLEMWFPHNYCYVK